MQQIELPSSRVDCWLLCDGRGPSIVDFVFDDVDPRELADALAPELQAPDGPYNCLLVRAEDALLLVDTGLGAAEHPLGGAGGELWAELRRVGVAPSDVDLVVMGISTTSEGSSTMGRPRSRELVISDLRGGVGLLDL